MIMPTTPPAIILRESLRISFSIFITNRATDNPIMKPIADSKIQYDEFGAAI
jgi:hypothetical protein